MAHHHPLPPPYIVAAAPPEYSGIYDERNDSGGINTLFVSGLPDDVKAREIHNLFRRRPGFDSCQLKYTGRGNQVVAFATFVNHQSAIAALHSLNGVKFDPQTGSTLHIELARSNSRRQHKPGRGPYVVVDRRRATTTKSHRDTTTDDDDDEDDDDDDDDAKEEEDDDNNNNGGGGRTDSDDSNSGNQDNPPQSSKQATDAKDALPPETEQAEKTTDGACSTLFIANLGPNCTEGELKQALSQYPGFNSLKVRARGGMPVAFADFERVEQATQAMNFLQGSTLPSSDRGGMHIEYARSKMRKP